MALDDNDLFTDQPSSPCIKLWAGSTLTDESESSSPGFEFATGNKV